MQLKFYVPSDIQKLKMRMTLQNYYNLILDALSIMNILKDVEPEKIGFQLPDGSFKPFPWEELKRKRSQWKWEARKVAFKEFFEKFSLNGF